MVEVKRKKGESFESFLRRFNKVVIHSGKLIEARKIRFHKRGQSKLRQRASALRRLTFKEHQTYLARIGKLPPDEVRRSKQRRSS